MTTSATTTTSKALIEIVPYQESQKTAWDQFVQQSVNGNFLHTRAFFDHNPANNKDDCSFMFFKKGRLAAVLPATLYQRDGRLVLQSHLRATFGGFVVNREVGTVEALELVRLLCDKAREMGVQEIVVRNPFRIFNRHLADETDYALWYHGFSLKSRELEIAIELAGTLDSIQKRFENGTKYNIKKAEKSVETRLCNDFENFWPILEKNLADRHGKKPVHSLQEILLLRELVGAENILIFGGYHEGRLICGTVIFRFGTQALHAQYIGSDSAFQDLRPINAVTHYIIKWGHENGFKYFNLGTANEDGGRVVNEGLFHFKEGFGGRGVLRETMHLML